ncbi:MAG TPA: MBOAT family protein [Bacteroidales bacterium]|nr:MAG: alginate O-acetyltransferase [Bacteroidetes bacterium GWF2_33_38]OFY76083.1 MAG: alginate O-acetyltransferase [Bacteroidetes bacterium RIFOXYA12_FULL_33_9]OFY91158.1 MAG: alginate O-acetyltransferase [Bacteroidetes bacterium RIFOXYA2_FULL_33_7]HBF88887.1 MBOAT family protein [Bacteroidales bacterium]
MLFSQLYFWGFFAVVLAVYSIIYKKNHLRNGFLFFVSLFFYYKSGGYFFSLLILSTLIDYTAGLLIYNSQKKIYKKLFISLSILSNLGLLAYFKYTYFLTDIINQVFHTNIHAYNILADVTNKLTGSGFDISAIILPVGISFYTFQTISYTVDVYRGKLAPVRNIIDFGFYVSFFPQLVAGPIVRAAEFIPQLYQEYKLTIQGMGHATFLILSGLIKKMLISDYISVNFVDRIFDSPLSYSGFENLLAAYGYSIQIYCDFSGYTDIAIGVALLMGFRLPVNFNSPYKALNISDFWRRWHISLSTWLRDYLYIPLGGSKKGIIRTNINLLITMILGGLWHGANLRFIVWGAIHGLSLVTHKIWIRIFKPKEKISIVRRFFAILFTFHTVTFSWIFFRAENMNVANQMFEQILKHFQPQLFFDILEAYRLVLILMALGLIGHWLPSMWKEKIRGWFIKSHIVVKLIVVVLFVLVAYQIKSSAIQPFIYFQF